MSVVERQEAVRAMRGRMRSPGRPWKARRVDRVRFWEGIAGGCLERGRCCRGGGVPGGWIEMVPPGWGDAADLFGFGVGPLSVVCRTGRDRHISVRRVLGCARSVVACVVARRRFRVSWGATPQPVAEAWSIGPRLRSGIRIGVPAARSSPSWPPTTNFVTMWQDRLGGQIARPDGELVPGPQVRWAGRRHGRRADRRWATSWSPEQISNRLRIDFPDNESMRISHEAIYQAAYVQGRGALKREFVACGRTGRALRVPRARTRRRRKHVRCSRDHDQPTPRRGRRPGSARPLGR